jgi:hypothetical protein
MMGPEACRAGNSQLMSMAIPTEKWDELLKLACQLKSGKRIATDRYLHFDNSEAVEILTAIDDSLPVPEGANVLRIGKTQTNFTMSFSYYNDYFDDPFPKLVWSEHHNLATGAVTRRSEGMNPAILHRKELLLNSGDPRRARYVGLTQTLIEKGLLPTREFIGRHDHWFRYLVRKGFKIRGVELTSLGDA